MPFSAFWIALCAELPLDAVVAADCNDDAAGLAIWGASTNGVTFEAAAEDPAYWNIAAESCAHISAYWASNCAMIPLLRPKTLVCAAWVNSARLAAINGGGTTAANAASKAAAADWACAAACSA